MTHFLRITLAALVVTACTGLAHACSLCATMQKALTLREEAAHPAAKMIVYGNLANPKLNVGDTGCTDLNIESVVRSHAYLKDKKVLQVERFIPVSDPKDPPRFLLFCDLFNERLDPYRGVPVKSKDVVAYLEGAMKLPADDPARRLLYFADFLEHSDPAIADDAFLEFAKSSDQELGLVAGKVSADKLRKWLKDPNIPGERLGLYAFLLGGCGNNDDADTLRTMLTSPTDRMLKGLDGLLAGYIQLQPKKGWELAYGILQTKDLTPSVQSAIRCMRCFHGWKGKEQHDNIMHGMEYVLARDDLADLAINDLRAWQEWELNAKVLALYGKKGYTAPIMRRAILAYAISCKTPEGKRIVDDARKQDPDFVADVEEGLKFDSKR